MILDNKRYEFGLLVKKFRKHHLGMKKFTFHQTTKMNRTELDKLERGDRAHININTLCFLIDLGLPIHELKNDATERNVREHLILDEFRNQIKSINSFLFSRLLLLLNYNL